MSDSSPPRPARIVPCPTCGGDSLFAPSNAWRPFCCERCKQIDLGAWAAEDYRVAAHPPVDASADPDEPLSPRPGPPLH